MRKWLISIIVLIIAISIYGYIYKDHRDIANETSEFKLSATDFLNAISSNQLNAQKKYLNKTIEVNGTISELDSNSITIDNKVWCLFTKPLKSSFSKENQIKIKGRCIGYDEFLEQVKLDQCIIIN